MRSLFIVIISSLILWSCSSEPEFKPVNLLEYGMPVTILAPDSPDIKKVNLVLQDDVSIKKGDDFYVQIFAAQATTNDPVKLKEVLKDDVLNNPFFAEMIEEFEHGFIYRDQIDSLHSTYGFRFAKIMGDREYVFQTGLTGSFTEEQVRKMYEAVQYKEK